MSEHGYAASLEGWAGSLLPDPVHRSFVQGAAALTARGGRRARRTPAHGRLHTDLVEAMSLPEWPVRTGRKA
jgi:hypothetical protein